MQPSARKLVTFLLADDRFAFDVDQVERVLRYRAPTPLPDVADWIVGALDHAGRVVPVIDMRRRVSLPPTRARFQTRIMMLATSAGLVGAVVDAVTEVAKVSSDSVQPPPELHRGISGEFIRGIVSRGDQLTVVLDAERIIGSDERIVLDRALAEVAPA